MKRIALLLCVMGCGPTSYGDATSARPVGPDRWIIEVNGRRLDSGLTLEYQQRKAAEVCPNGFTIEETSGGEKTTGYIVTSSNTAVPVRRTDAAAVVRCQ